MPPPPSPQGNDSRSDQAMYFRGGGFYTGKSFKKKTTVIYKVKFVDSAAFLSICLVWIDDQSYTSDCDVQNKDPKGN